MVDIFKNRTVVIATKHKKEKAIAPLLETELGVKCIVPENFDTDTLGTFTGEVARADDAIITLRRKCEMAMKISGCTLAVGNEGSFGPHPSMFFVHADDEIVMLLDKVNNLEIVERELNTDTNFNGKEIHSEQELLDFANIIKFPSHGIILKRAKSDFSMVIKGIVALDELVEKYNLVKNNIGVAYAETDMRAMYNPTRMGNIELATRKLLARIKSLCPACGTPGYGVEEIKRGLPCSACNSPTRSVLSHVFTCKKCSFSGEVLYPWGKESEDPMYCDECNP